MIETADESMTSNKLSSQCFFLGMWDSSPKGASLTVAAQFTWLDF